MDVDAVQIPTKRSTIISKKENLLNRTSAHINILGHRSIHKQNKDVYWEHIDRSHQSRSTKD